MYQYFTYLQQTSSCTSAKETTCCKPESIDCNGRLIAPLETFRSSQDFAVHARLCSPLCWQHKHVKCLQPTSCKRINYNCTIARFFISTEVSAVESSILQCTSAVFEEWRFCCAFWPSPPWCSGPYPHPSMLQTPCGFDVAGILQAESGDGTRWNLGRSFHSRNWFWAALLARVK